MKIVALLAWFDEPTEWLYEACKSLAGIADEVVALDGAYALLSGARARSSDAEWDAIREGAKDGGLQAFVHAPDAPFAGNQLEKRTRLFKLGEERTTPYEDWYFIIDADEFAESPDAAAVRDELANADAHTIDVWFETLEGESASFNEWELAGYQVRHPRFFRVLRDMRVETAHWFFTGVLPSDRRVAVKGQNLAESHGLLRGERALLDAEFVLKHRVFQQEEARFYRKYKYQSRLHEVNGEFATPDAAGLESVKGQLA